MCSASPCVDILNEREDAAEFQGSDSLTEMEFPAAAASSMSNSTEPRLPASAPPVSNTSDLAMVPVSVRTTVRAPMVKGKRGRACCCHRH